MSLISTALWLASTPPPMPNQPPIDPNRVTPGLFGFLSFVALIVAVVLLYFSMRKQLSRIDFEDDAMVPAGMRPLPKYATKEERRKAAEEFDRARGIGVDPEASADGAGAGRGPAVGGGAAGGSQAADTDGDNRRGPRRSAD